MHGIPRRAPVFAAERRRLPDLFSREEVPARQEPAVGVVGVLRGLQGEKGTGEHARHAERRNEASTAAAQSGVRGHRSGQTSAEQDARCHETREGLEKMAGP